MAIFRDGWPASTQANCTRKDRKIACKSGSAVAISLTLLFFQEALWRKQHSHFKKKWAPPPLPQNLDVPSSEPKDLAQIYRDLRKGREDAKNEPGAADFSYSEMEMRRQSDPWDTRCLLDAYWIVSDYGLRPLHSALCLIRLTLAMTFCLQSNEIKHWEAFLLSLGHLLNMNAQEIDSLSVGVHVPFRLLGAILLGLTVPAVRGRVKRRLRLVGETGNIEQASRVTTTDTTQKEAVHRSGTYTCNRFP